MKKQKTTAIAKVDEKKKAIWVGSLSLMGTVVPGSKEAKERAVIKMTAEVLEVSPFGINILGSLPYINKLGLGQKSRFYGDGKDEFKYNWIQRAIDDNQKAICECKIVRDGKDITDWVTGECSPKTMKMGTLQGYQNHMAQTRAKNRAILEAYGVQIHEDMIQNIGKKLEEKRLTEKQAEALVDHAGKATSTSTEEVELDKKQKQDPLNNDLFNYEPVKTAANGNPVIEFECHGCANPITKQEAEYSKKMFGKPLCRDCQKEHKKK